MKKIVSLALAVVMLFAMSVTVFAAGPYENFNTNPQEEKNVEATYDGPENTAGTVYYFTIAWEATGGSNLKYTGAKGVYTWDGLSMQYTKADSSTNAEWTGSAGYKVTVINQSNASIYATTETTNEYNLTLDTTNWDKEQIGAADTALVRTDENGVKTYNITDSGSPVQKSITYTYTAREIGADQAKEPPVGSDPTITVGKITVTVQSTNA